MRPAPPLGDAPRAPAAEPEAKNIRISPKDGMTQILIPAGTFTMGAMDVYRENDEQPVREIFIDAFWMDQVRSLHSFARKR